MCLAMENIQVNTKFDHNFYILRSGMTYIYDIVKSDIYICKRVRSLSNSREIDVGG